MLQETIIIVDRLTALRDYCVQKDHPLPTFTVHVAKLDLVFVECTVGHVRTIGTASTEEEATHRSAAKMKACIFEKPEPSKQITSLEEDAKKAAEMVDFRLRTYAEFMGKNYAEMPGVPLCDRHMYLTKYPKHIKNAAWQVIRNPDNYGSQEEQAMELFAALRMVPTIKEVAAVRGMEKQVIIDCNNKDYDLVFIRRKSKIWEDVITYFSEMLE